MARGLKHEIGQGPITTILQKILKELDLLKKRIASGGNSNDKADITYVDSQDVIVLNTANYYADSKINGIYQPNVLISAVPPTRVTNTFTFPALGYDALINKVRYKNSIDFVTTIDVATTNYKRTDLIYITTGGIIGKKVGTESTTVSIRPDLNSDEVAISFINVFGNIIETPTLIDNEISVQDAQGNEKFKIKDYLRFENVSFNSQSKSIFIDSLIPLSAFLDTINGNDFTAAIENSKKPFKTIEGLFNSLPATSGETYTIYITGGTVPVTRRINMRNLRFIAYKDTTLDFTNVMENDGVTNATAIFNTSAAEVTWTFENKNISIVSNYVGVKYFSFIDNNCRVSLQGTLRTLNWKSMSNSSSSGGVYIGATSSLTIINCYQNTQATQTLFFCRIGNPIITIDNYYYSVGGSNALCGAGSTGGINFTIVVNNVFQIGSTTGLTVNLGCISGSVSDKFWDITINNISPNVLTTFRCPSNKLTLSGYLNSLVNFDIIGVLYLTGKVNSVNYIFNSYLGGSQTIDRFNGKLGKLDLYINGTLIISDSQIQTDTYLASRGYNHNFTNCIFFKGYTTVNQIQTSNNLFKTTGSGGGGNIQPILLSIETLTTNALTYGIYVNYIKTQSTFKEKLNEVVIRSKVDLVNKVLSPATTYIIDGTLTLLTGEYIQVPAGGLTIAGYGFDVSQINKNVAGQSIFTSPVGNSGNFVSRDMQYMSGLGSVFNITDSDGSHAIELNDVNFQSCSSLGIIKGYRQFTGTTCGFYSCKDGFQLSGNWTGFKLTNSNVLNFNTGTFIKKDTNTLFSNRLYLDLNLSFQTGAKLSDFSESNFSSDELFQINNTLLKVNNIIDDVNTTSVLPNITANNPKSRWTNSLGLKLTAMKFQDLKSANKVWRLEVNDSGVISATEIQ